MVGDVCINARHRRGKTIQPANGKENVLITLQEVNELLANKELGKSTTSGMYLSHTLKR